MRESFVIHSEYIEDLPAEYQQKFLMLIYQYGIHEQVPHLEGLELSLWVKIQRRIDGDRESYEKKLEYMKNYRKNKKIANSSQSSQSSEIFKTIHPISHSDIDIVNDIDSVNDIVSDIDIDIVNDIENENKGTVSSLSPSQTEYSKQILAIFKEAGLPCCRGNEVSFLMRDFKNGLSYIHSSNELRHLHSDEILGACRNYVSVLQDKRCFLNTKFDFYSLVKSKHFWKLLPSNFNIDNFIDWKLKGKEVPETQNISFEMCPSCNQLTMFWSNDTESYYCSNCRKTLSYEDVNK